MDVNVIAEDLESQNQALLLPNAVKTPKTKTQKAIRKTFKGTTQLSKLLPTGSVLVFQVLCPILTHEGQCKTLTSQYLTLAVVLLCALSCFVLSFTDSFRDERGKVRYGLVTRDGLWVIDDGSVKLSHEESERYKLKFLDFIHASISVLVFYAVALFNQNVVNCFFPQPSDEIKRFLVIFPVAVALISALVFLVFPTKRNAIGSPLSKK